MPDSLRLRKPEKDYSPDPTVWLASHRMTQTEVSLRLARFLLVSRLATSDVTVALTAHELTRRDTPQFPVERFLTIRDFVRAPSQTNDWQGAYLLNGARDTDPRLELVAERDGADVITTVRTQHPPRATADPHDPTPPGHRLIVQASRGLLGDTRSPAEHKWLRSTIGRAVTYEKACSTDILAVAAPRSNRFRDLATKWRGADGMLRCGCMILLVDRSGNVDGLPYDYRAASPAIVVRD